MRCSCFGLVLLVACAEPSVGSHTSAIAGGVESDREAIVAVASSTGSLCTGAVVGPRHVLTLKICVFDGDMPQAASALMVLGGAVLRSPDRTGSVAEVMMADSTGPALPPPADTNDFALLVLTEDFGVVPLPIGATRPTVDDTLTIAGFGQDEMGGSGNRREGNIAVSSLMDDFFFTGDGLPNTCQADGPALDASDALVGLALFSSGACPPDLTGYRDLTVHREEVMAWIGPVDSDAGVQDAGNDAGDIDAGTGDGGSADAGPDSGMTGDGGCSAASGSSGVFLFLLGLVFRRRR